MDNRLDFARAGRACSEFVVFPPAGDRHCSALAVFRLQTRLQRRFPGYRFRISGTPLPSSDDYLAVPVMGAPGGEAGTIVMLAPPPEGLVRDLATELASFDPDEPVPGLN